jgi:hypothetical protein
VLVSVVAAVDDDVELSSPPQPANAIAPATTATAAPILIAIDT